VAVAALLTACSTASPDVVRREDAQRQSQIFDATVLSIRDVKIDGSQSGGGGVAGAALGGLAGSTMGGGRGRDAAVIVGAIAGAMAGNAMERGGTSEDGEELLLQFTNGERRIIVQAKGADRLMVGDNVVVIQTANKFRVVRAPNRGTAPAPAPAPAHNAAPAKG